MGRADSRTADVIARLVSYGDDPTLRRLAADVAAGDLALARLLAETARSDEDDALRARCVEVLGLALKEADHQVRWAVLTSLFGHQRSETVLGL
jgi:hypothetical protein